MAAGDILTQTGGTPPLAWVAPATVIAADGQVLASVASGGVKIPQWLTASAAIAGGNNVLTVYDDVLLGAHRPAWLPLSAPSTTWTIQLVAGGTTQANNFGDHGLSPAVDGSLGTNTMYGPSVMAFAPDGSVWFLDGAGGELRVRSYDPATGMVQSRFDNAAGAGGDFAELGIAVDGDGNVWISYEVDDDIPYATIRVTSADGATFLGRANDSSRGGPLGGVPTAIALSPDGTRLYYGFGRDGGSGIFYLDTADVLAGDFITSSTSLADVPGQTVGVSTDADGNVYSVSYDFGGAAVVTSGGAITPLSNVASGTGYGGDGLAAYTSGDDTPQLANPVAIAYDPVSGVVGIVDHDNFVVRAISARDGTGKLSTIAGTAGSSGSGLGDFPDATPADALTKGLGGSINSILPIPGGGFYVSTGTDFDDFGVDGIWGIYLLLPPGASAGSGAGLDVLTVSGGAVTGMIVSAAGSGYHFPLSVVFTPDPRDTSASGAAAHISGIDPTDGSITGVTLDSGGSGYTHLPTATIV